MEKGEQRELHILYSSPDIIRQIKSRIMRWVVHVACMVEGRDVYRVLVGLTYSLTPWHCSPDGHKPPLIRFHSLIFFSVFEEQVANLLPQHFFESA
jgi:hypothetical protein